MVDESTTDGAAPKSRLLDWLMISTGVFVLLAAWWMGWFTYDPIAELNARSRPESGIPLVSPTDPNRYFSADDYDDEKYTNEWGRFRLTPPERFHPLVNPSWHYWKSIDADDISNDAPVLGFAIGNEAFAYPLRMMWYHHVVNHDTEEHGRIAVTFCTMANTSVAYQLPTAESGFRVGGLMSGTLVVRTLDGDEMYPQVAPEIPVSGWTSDESQRPQIVGQVVQTTWGAWRARHPESTCIQAPGSYYREYKLYDNSMRSIFVAPPARDTMLGSDDRLGETDDIFGVAWNGEAVAWPMAIIEGEGRVSANVGGEEVVVVWDEILLHPLVESAPEGVVAMRAFWFAWSSFYPETLLLDIPDDESPTGDTGLADGGSPAAESPAP